MVTTIGLLALSIVRLHDTPQLQCSYMSNFSLPINYVKEAPLSKVIRHAILGEPKERASMI